VNSFNSYPTTFVTAQRGGSASVYGAQLAPLVPAYRDILTALMGVDPSFTETQEALVWVWDRGASDSASLLFYVSTSMQGQFTVAFTRKGSHAEKIMNAITSNDGKLTFDKGADIEFFVAAFTAMFDKKDVRVQLQDGLMYCWLEQGVFLSYYTAGVKSSRIEISFSSSSPARTAILALGSEFGGKLEPQPGDPTQNRSAPRKRDGKGVGL